MMMSERPDFYKDIILGGNIHTQITKTNHLIVGRFGENILNCKNNLQEQMDNSNMKVFIRA